jgi:hypothetical protein
MSTIIDLQKYCSFAWKIRHRNHSSDRRDAYIDCDVRGRIFAIGDDTLQFESSATCGDRIYRKLHELAYVDVSERRDDKRFTATFEFDDVEFVAEIVRPTLNPDNLEEMMAAERYHKSNPQPRHCTICRQLLRNEDLNETQHVQCSVDFLSRKLGAEGKTAARRRMEQEKQEADRRKSLRVITDKSNE